MDMFAILGDNFYDQTGELAKTIFDQLSPDVKRRFLFVARASASATCWLWVKTNGTILG